MSYLGVLFDAFSAGLKELYETFFSSVLFYPLLDEEAGNVYDEKENKTYGVPLSIRAKVALSSEEYVNKFIELPGHDCMLSVPVIFLQELGLQYDPPDYNYFWRGKFVIFDIPYTVVHTIPSPVIEGKVLVVQLFCKRSK